MTVLRDEPIAESRHTVAVLRDKLDTALAERDGGYDGLTAHQETRRRRRVAMRPAGRDSSRRAVLSS
jgi:hypothetical protein